MEDNTVELGSERIEPVPVETPMTGAVRPDTTTGPATNGPITNGVSLPAPDRVANLEAELANWQRRAVLWRERALSAQGLNAALSEHLDDLRAVLQLRTEAETETGAGSTTHSMEVRHREPVDQWWNRVFRRETWTSR